jgi:hypothetical protein
VPSVFDPGAFRCADPNWEFFRPNAALELVFFSVSEDGSPDDVADYVDFFTSLKGSANPGLVRAHAVVGDTGGGCKGPTGLAFAGDRYGEVASALGGKRHSICQPSWASVFAEEPGDTFGLITTVALTRPPLPASIMVTVDGAACQSGWAYDAAANAIHVDPAGACMPAAGETVAISYETVCFPE